MTTCHIAGLVKGVIERNDGTVHFGSLMGYSYHLSCAKEIGVVEEFAGVVKVTSLGLSWYEQKRMAELPYPSRSSAWCLVRKDEMWELPIT